MKGQTNKQRNKLDMYVCTYKWMNSTNLSIYRVQKKINLKTSNWKKIKHVHRIVNKKV